jgi:hypothetical protein
MKVQCVIYQNTTVFKAENTILGFYINMLNIIVTSEAKDVKTFLYIINILEVKGSEETKRER